MGDGIIPSATLALVCRYTRARRIAVEGSDDVVAVQPQQRAGLCEAVAAAGVVTRVITASTPC